MLRAVLLGLIIVSATDATGQIRLSGASSPPLLDVEGGSRFGTSVTEIGDLNHDGVGDLAVGAPLDSESGPDAGAVWILFMNPDGSVESVHKISEATDNFTAYPRQIKIGRRLSGLGDWRGRGVSELAIGSPGVGTMVSLNSDGTVGRQERFPEPTNNPPSPESILVVMGDVDGNGVTDLAESRHNSPTGDVLIFLYKTPEDYHEPQWIGQGSGGMPASAITFNDQYCWSMTNVGDLNGDGRDELACGTPGDDDYFDESGAVYILFLSNLGTVNTYQKISLLDGNLGADLQSGDLFGESVANVGDLDGDGLSEIAVGSPGRGAGSVWVLSLNSDGTVRNEFEIKAADYGILEPGTPDLAFGVSVATTEDYSGDGLPDLAVGVPYQDAVLLLPVLADIPATGQFSEPDPNASVGKSVPVEVTARGVGGTSSVEIHFSQGGADLYLSDEMERTGDAYSYSIPPFVGSSRGLEYYVTVTNVAGVESRLPQDGFISIPLLVPDGILVDVSSGNTATGYRIVSIPLEYQDVSLLDVLKSSLGEHDSGVWRAFGVANGVASEFDNPRTSAGSGSAIWLLHSEAGRVLRAGTGRSIRTDRPFKIPLDRDWNLIGNPFDFDVSVDALSTALGRNVELLSYDGDWRVVEDVLEPRQGYAMFSVQVDTLVMDLTRRPTTFKRARSFDRQATDWSVVVRATDELSRDFNNAFGTAPLAASGWDSFDAPEPPAVGDYVAAYFALDEPGSPTPRLRSDVRPPMEGTASWRLEAVSATQRRVTLSFDDVETVPRDLDILLFDPVSGQTQNLRTRPEYTLVGGPPNRPRELLITVGHGLSSNLSSEPDPISNGLESFPNPFSGAATIRFDVATPSPTSLRVYDIAGREVASIWDNRQTESGVHAAIWDGRDDLGRKVASGLYFVKLESGGLQRSIAVSVTR